MTDQLALGRSNGLRLVGTDQCASWGEGDEISGASPPLPLGVLGRAAALPELSGAVSVLHGRL